MDVVEETKMKAAEGNMAAQFNLGQMHNLGYEGVEKNHEKAIEWWTKAADQGLATAQYNMVLHFLQHSNPNNRQAFSYMEKAAIGYFYYEGLAGVVDKDYNEAFRWYQRAAEKHQTDALLNLGQMYQEGEGTPVNYEKAGECFEINSELHGDMESQFFLASLLATGKGGPQDLGKARELLVHAESSGHPGARDLMIMLAGVGHQ
jgi:TPR repeat protein